MGGVVIKAPPAELVFSLLQKYLKTKIPFLLIEGREWWMADR